MCGLVAVITRNCPVDPGRLRAAADTIRHRGPDSYGEAFTSLTMADGARIDVGLAFRRLSIIDLDARSDQPMRRGGHALVYNGELYNFRDLRAGLAAQGDRFETDGDSEVLLRLLMRYGPAGLANANGMWAFCLLDEPGRRLIAGRDRYGKKPLFYYHDNATICFASEIKAIMAYLGQAPHMRRDALDTYLAHGWLFPGGDHATHIEGINQVPPGTGLAVDFERWNIELQSAAPFPVADHNATTPGDLAAVLSDAVRQRLVSDRNIGLLLSGGVDSSLILSILATLGLADRVQCYVGDAGKSEDAAYARACLDKLGVAAKVIPIDYGRDSVDRFLRVCRHQEKPFPMIGNVLGLPQLYEAIAADNVPVVLDGTGADEIFGGYPERSLPLAIADAHACGDIDYIDSIVAANADDARIADLCAATVHALAASPTVPVLASLPPQMADHELDFGHLLHPEVASASDSDPLMSFNGPLAAGLTMDATRGRLQEWLWQNDRTAMQAGVENRSPFLDHRLARWLATPACQKVIGPWMKHEIRVLFDRFIPLPTQWRRQKQGFRWVYGRFLRANRAALLDLVSASRLLPERVKVGALVDEARHNDAALLSEIMQRSICIAALEDQFSLKL